VCQHKQKKLNEKKIKSTIVARITSGVRPIGTAIEGGMCSFPLIVTSKFAMVVAGKRHNMVVIVVQVKVVTSTSIPSFGRIKPGSQENYQKQRKNN
jgi:hypothetical protein